MAKVLTKSQVVAHLAEKAGIQKKAAAAVLEHLAALATKEVKGGGQFVVPGLGKAVKAHRKLAWVATLRPVSPSTFQRRRSSSFAWPRHSRMPWCLQRRSSDSAASRNFGSRLPAQVACKLNSALSRQNRARGVSSRCGEGSPGGAGWWCHPLLRLPCSGAKPACGS